MKQHRSGLIAFRRAPVIVASTLWVLAGCLLMFVHAGDANRQVQLFWAFQPPLDMLLAYTSWRVFRLATGPARRFWAVLSLTRPRSRSATRPR